MCRQDFRESLITQLKLDNAVIIIPPGDADETLGQLNNLDASVVLEANEDGGVIEPSIELENLDEPDLEVNLLDGNDEEPIRID